jgi:hypothetical protein
MLVTGLYKSEKAQEAGVWRIYWHVLPVLNFISGLSTPVPISSNHQLLGNYHLLEVNQYMTINSKAVELYQVT